MIALSRPGAEIARVHQQKIQQRNRRLIASLPILLVMVLIAVKLISLTVLGTQAQSAFVNGDGKRVKTAGQGQSVVNVVEPWKAHFSLGDAYVLSSDFAQAKTEFLAALDSSAGVHECKVRSNLAKTNEQLGDDLSEKDPGGAKKQYQEGLEIIAQAPKECFDPNSPSNQEGEGKSLAATKSQLLDKVAKSESAQETPSEHSQQKENDSAHSSEEKLKQLQQEVDEAAKQRSKVTGSSSEESGSDGPNYSKPW